MLTNVQPRLALEASPAFIELTERYIKYTLQFNRVRVKREI